MRTSYVKNGLVVGIILLFVGVAIAPSMNANVYKDNEMIEYTTELFGSGGGEQIVKLTQEQSQEVEQLLDSIQERLDSTETNEEAEEIFKEAVVELNKYGLLGGLSVKQAQELVLGDFSVHNNQNILGIGPNFFTNIFCLCAGTIYGHLDFPYSFCYPLSLSLIPVMLLVELFSTIGWGFFSKIFFTLIVLHTFFNPLRFFNIIGGLSYDWDITSLGLKGLINSSEKEEDLTILGLTGLLISSLDESLVEYHFLGFSLGIFSSTNIPSEVVG